MTNTLVNRYADYILVELVLSRAHKNKSRANAWNEFRKPNLVEFSKFRKTTVQGMLEREEMMITNWRFFFSLSTRDRLFWQQINKENFQHTDVHATTTKNTTLQMETRKPIKSSDRKPDNSCERIYTIVFVFLFIFFFCTVRTHILVRIFEPIWGDAQFLSFSLEIRFHINRLDSK